MYMLKRERVYGMKNTMNSCAKNKTKLKDLI
jgi:hypothetical protein